MRSFGSSSLLAGKTAGNFFKSPTDPASASVNSRSGSNTLRTIREFLPWPGQGIFSAGAGNFARAGRESSLATGNAPAFLDLLDYIRQNDPGEQWRRQTELPNLDETKE
jgi:hypothetical protein